MPLQTSGQIALSDIMRETAMSSVPSYSLDNGENGQTTIGYPRINLCSPARPSDNDGCSLSEWRGYDHYITCNTYRWTAVYNDSNPDICGSFPTNPPVDTPTPSGCIETYPNSPQWCICQGMDPQPVTYIQDTYDGRTGKLLFLNYFNNVHSIVIYNISGQALWTQPAGTAYSNGSFSFAGFSQATYLISYKYFCGPTIGSFNCERTVSKEEAAKLTYYGTISVGSLASASTLYSQETSGTTVCDSANQIKFVYYNLGSTSTSAVVNTVFYMDSAKTVTASAGAYAMANGYKFIVNSSGVVTSATASCTANPDMFGKYFRKSTSMFYYKTNVTITVGNCYLFENYTNPSTSYVRGTVTSYNPTTGEVIITNYSGG